MLNYRKSIVLISIILLLIGASCGGSDDLTASVSDADQAFTQAAEIANAGMTSTVAAIAQVPSATQVEPSATATQLILPSPTLAEFTATFTPDVEQATATFTPPPTQPQTGGTPCYRARFESETIPDGRRINRGLDFTKVWRIQNTGTCTWTPAVDIIFIEGDILNASSSVQLTTIDILPGEYVDAIIEMQSPMAVGDYRGYWMLRSPEGEIFGVGADGTGWFWVDIVSIDPEV